MNKLRKARAQAQAQQFVPLHPYLAGVSDDTPFWRDMPDILQAQLLVMLDNGRPTKKNPTPREAEKLLWAGTPHLRKRTIFLLFVLWMILLIVPTLTLIELVDEIGGWCALGWAVVSVSVGVDGGAGCGVPARGEVHPGVPSDQMIWARPRSRPDSSLELPKHIERVWP